MLQSIYKQCKFLEIQQAMSVVACVKRFKIRYTPIFSFSKIKRILNMYFFIKPAYKAMSHLHVPLNIYLMMERLVLRRTEFACLVLVCKIRWP